MKTTKNFRVEKAHANSNKAGENIIKQRLRQYFLLPTEIAIETVDICLTLKRVPSSMDKLFESLEFYCFLLKPEQKKNLRKFITKLKPEESDLLIIASYICHVSCEEKVFKNIRLLESLATYHGYKRLFKPLITLMKMTKKNPDYYRECAKGSLIFDIYSAFPSVDVFFEFFLEKKVRRKKK